MIVWAVLSSSAFSYAADVGDGGNAVGLRASASSPFSGSILAGDCQDSSAVTVTGAKVNSECSVGLPAAPPDDSMFMCWVSAANQVKVRGCSFGLINITPPTTVSVRVLNS